MKSTTHTPTKWAWLACLIILLCQVASAEPYKVFRMTVGEQKPLATKYSVKRSAIGNPEVATLKVLNSREFLLTAKRQGSTQLMLWQGSSEPTVMRIDVVPAISRNAAAGVHISAEGNTTIIEGKTQSLSQHQSLRRSVGEGVIDNTTQRGAVQVQTDIKIVEYSRTQLKQIGTALGFTGGDTSLAVGSNGLLPILSGDGPVGQLLGGLSAGTSASSILIGHATDSFRAAVNALQQNGYAYTLAEPSLVSLSGQTATFLAGGEFPYPISNRDGQVQIEFKEFGVRLQLTPTILAEDSIMLKVAPEVSDLDFTSGVQASGVNVPSLRVRRTDTSIQLAPGESFIISGLISRNTFNNADKVPGLGDIPILGALFRSTRFQQEDKELIMIVTPHLVKPLAKGTNLDSMPGDIYKHYTPSFLDMMFGNTEHPPQPTKNVGFSN